MISDILQRNIKNLINYTITHHTFKNLSGLLDCKEHLPARIQDLALILAAYKNIGIYL